MKLIIKEFYIPFGEKEGGREPESRFVLATKLNEKELYFQPVSARLHYNTFEEILAEIARIDPKDSFEVKLTRVNRYRRK
jgi:hypothetical protein